MTIDVIEAVDGTTTEMVRRVPSKGSGEFKLGSQVIVRESQTAIFFRDGMSLDTFGPGRHTISTLNMPLIGARITDRVFGQSPFKAEVYFVDNTVFLGIKWGTPTAIPFRDRELSLINLRAHGEMAIRISNPVLFVNKVVGTKGTYGTKEIQGFLKSIVISALTSQLPAVLGTIFDLASRYPDLATATRATVYENFASYGVELEHFVIESITPPDEVQARINERTGIAAVGNLDDYLRYKSAIALGEAANSRGGGGGAGGVVGEAAGLGLGISVLRSIQDGVAPHPHQQAQAASPTTTCPACTHAIAVTARFCPDCGVNLQSATCTNCKATLTAAAKFCATCGTATK